LGQHNGKEKKDGKKESFQEEKVFKKKASLVIFAFEEKTLPQGRFFFSAHLSEKLKHANPPPTFT